jgi:hypothetical protein
VRRIPEPLRMRRRREDRGNGERADSRLQHRFHCILAGT